MATKIETEYVLHEVDDAGDSIDQHVCSGFHAAQVKMDRLRIMGCPAMALTRVTTRVREDGKIMSRQERLLSYAGSVAALEAGDWNTAGAKFGGAK